LINFWRDKRTGQLYKQVYRGKQGHKNHQQQESPTKRVQAKPCPKPGSVDPVQQQTELPG